MKSALTRTRPQETRWLRCQKWPEVKRHYLDGFHLPPEHLLHLLGELLHQLLAVHLLHLHHALDVLEFLQVGR